MNRISRLPFPTRGFRQVRRRGVRGIVYVKIGNILTGGWWTYLFLLPGSLFATNPAFNGLAHHAPEWKWCMAFVIGVGLECASSFARSPLFRLCGLAWMSGLWAGVSICMAVAAPIVAHSPVSTGLGVYATLSIISIIAANQTGKFAILDAILIYRGLRRRKRAKRWKGIAVHG